MTRPKQWQSLWRGKTCLQLLRGVMVYVWPLSIIGGLFYRLRWSKPSYQFINRQSRRVFDSIPQQLHPLSVEAVRALRTHGIFRSSVEALANDANLFHDLSRDAQMLLGGRRYNARSGSDTIPTMPNGMWCEPSAIVPSGRRCPHLSSGFFFTRRYSASPVPISGCRSGSTIPMSGITSPCTKGSRRSPDLRGVLASRS